MDVIRFLRHGIRAGQLTVIDANGDRHVFGTDRAPRATIHLHDRRLARELFFNPWLKTGEAYMDGRLTLEEGSLADFFDVIYANEIGLRGQAWQRMLFRIGRAWGWIVQHNPIERAMRRVAHHYDLSRQLFQLFLDPSMQYSCAYFTRPDVSLAEAQQAKLRHVAAKLRLEPGQRVLDIGSGWGSLALHLAREAGVEVLGVTLSREQLEAARERAQAAGLAHRVRFELMDYRQVEGSFDRIVSIGMFEHVGLRHYDQFFAQISKLLAPNGVALLHSIGRADGPGVTNPWVEKYIFPGGYCPALSEVTRAVERSDLWIADIEILRLHYAETLKAWRHNFEANRASIARLYDERFCRMWAYYLAGCEFSFRHRINMVFQMQLCRDAQAVPLTRNYISEAERVQTHDPAPPITHAA